MCTELNSFRYKNFRCARHNKFFEVNLYQRNPIVKHHWRANLARPAQNIDLALRQSNPSRLLSKEITEANMDGEVINSPPLSTVASSVLVSHN